ncbi:glycosyl hydrolases family 15-domain-containing protein [Globomyces pollinis-pini]|nr:glycosyl hydrolases family 15-domain-containing protein [Globomyces pollinis-pini]
MSSKLRKAQEKLDVYYQEVTTIILSRQNAASGLIPASVAITAHGDYRDAWVRDNVYSIMAVWGLALAYRRLDDDQGRAYELEHATIKCMRGLLFAMMRQAKKVEQFKCTQALNQALHAKYNTATGDTVVGDNQWGHLQIDATSIYLLCLAQMTVSGLHIIYTVDEVQFIQNLVFYIERGYRTPDYGIWERGNKMNHGQPELNMSSIGMVVAALQAINGVNLFGSRGGQSSVIHVLPDEIARNYTTLHSALPRESPSKEIDAALMAVISFPAFAVGDVTLINRTRMNIVKKLGGRFGCKRFLRDGHQTVLEDHNRLHYEPHELKIFENVESEWPLFFTYLILDGLFYGDKEQVEKYRDLMEPLLVDSNTVGLYSNAENTEMYEADPKPSMKLVPELFIVPKESIDEERKNPGSQERVPNQNVPLVWAQSLFILGNLIYDDLLSVADIDPLGRRLGPAAHAQQLDTVVQVVLLADSVALQQRLATYGLETHTIENCAPITISKPSSLRDAYSFLGRNEKQGLSGRPDRPMGTLSTSKIYRCQGQLYAFLPHFMDREEFYLVSDNDYLVSLFEEEISTVRNHWMSSGRPTIVVMLTNQMLGNLETHSSRAGQNTSKHNLLNFFISIGSTGVCNGTRVRVGRLSEMVNTACVESLDFLINRGDVAESWDALLRGSEPPNSHKLKSDPIADYQTKTHLPMRSRSIRTTLPPVSVHDLPTKSPLAKSVGYSPEMEELTLMDKESASPIKRAQSPAPLEDAPVSLPLGNPSQTKVAIELLYTCNDIHDQADLLHYLYSCHGLQYEIPGLAPLNVLLEEVYRKGMHFKNWSVVRQAAGILRKTVNSLTSNLADLLIRQKPVTIGIRPKEYFIDSPKNPTALAQIIFENCIIDTREAPLIQEIITYLGQIIRGQPALFSGIMRIRTHFFVIAMREEISRAIRCDEERAIEHLMQLSPFELKTLLQQVLIAHDQVDGLYFDPAKLASKRVILKEIGKEKPAKESKPQKATHKLVISAQSGGFDAGDFANIEIQADDLPISFPFPFGRGLNMIALDPYDGNIIDAGCFDLHSSEAESEIFAQRIESLDDGVIVAIAAKDDFFKKIRESAIKGCESIGSQHIRNVQFRDSWCIIGEKGASIGSVPEFHRFAHLGPTEKITSVIDLTTRSLHPDEKRMRRPSGGPMLPSDGRWLRRRRNDGALNRVPPEFYPKVWRLLSKTTGIKVGSAVLKSHPTISESTPEELNFALQVENLLDNFIDPAEHQIAVECLVVISRIEERNPELTLIGSVIDLRSLIKEAIIAFWNSWISEQYNQIALTPLICKTDDIQKVIDNSSNTPLIELSLDIPKAERVIKDRDTSPRISDVSAQAQAKAKTVLKNAKRCAEDEQQEKKEDDSEFSYDKNDKLARRIFFDVRQDGVNGTMSYLATACVRHAFGVVWTPERANAAANK